MNPATVMVVEDNPFTRKVVERALRRAGHQVVLVESGHAAIEQMSVCRPQLVLQDIALGDMDGIQLLGKLRALAAPDVHFVAFTGGGDDGELRGAGFDDVIHKPVGLSDLTSVVGAHMRGEKVARSVGKPTDVWASLMAMLTQVTELSRSRMSRDELHAEILASLLHTCGLSVGFGFGIEAGKLVPLAHIGVAPRHARALAAEWATHAACTDAVRGLRPVLIHRDRDRDLFDRTGITSLLVIPLHVHDEATAVLAVASTGDELPDHWLQFASTVAGPIASTIKLAETIARLAASEHRFRNLAGSTADAILMTDYDGTVTYANPAAERTLGAKLVDQPVRELLAGRANLESSARSFEDPPGHLNWVYVVRDVSARERMVELESLATRDAMTGLYNRHRFDEEMASRLASSIRHRTPGSVLLIDLDRFKPINDTFGHAAGDAVLCAVGKTLQLHLRTSDLAARLGGDEFAIVLDHTGRAGAERCADKLLACLRELVVPFNGVSLSVGASIGIATFPEPGDRADAVLARADDALYVAKRDGRGVAR